MAIGGWEDRWGGGGREGGREGERKGGGERKREWRGERKREWKGEGGGGGEVLMSECVMKRLGQEGWEKDIVREEELRKIVSEERERKREGGT